MDKILADLLTRQRAALKAEATALSASADKDNAGVLTADQETRFKAIEADIGTIDAQIAAAQRTAETPEQIADRVRAEIADVTAACALAGQPARAAEFIKAKTPLAQVVSTLQAERATPENINPRNPGKSGKQADAAEIEAGWEAAADKVNAQFGIKRG
ncbi:MAG: hypothetical protein EOS70_23390 [Mesorhizobium sp.]|uniref:hypothetical protein n=1 Tax=Mesorhizobium sp. TaxID=1871066 RepID=UPI000FE83921|nr:hypothetical protein [Mesorhizobium sp.]RWC29835.1 MAG: hypothetical protein EOS70_23390 [Mesorhizobium sp.]